METDYLDVASFLTKEDREKLIAWRDLIEIFIQFKDIEREKDEILGGDTYQDIAKKINYPKDWDVAAYPTLAHALWERLCWVQAKKGGDN